MRILIIGAHYDDIELSAGGYLTKESKIVENDVYAIVTTTSDYTKYTGKIERTKKQAFEEGRSALKFLGIDNIWNLGYPTKDMPFNRKSVESINKLIDKLDPHLIITHHLSSSHQDHINTCKAVMAAARYRKNVWMFEPLYPDKMSNVPFKPIIYAKIDGFFEKKIESLKMHKSQFKKYPDWIDLVTSVNRLRGIENQCKYAEAFEPIKIGV